MRDMKVEVCSRFKKRTYVFRKHIAVFPLSYGSYMRKYGKSKPFFFVQASSVAFSMTVEKHFENQN